MKQINVAFCVNNAYVEKVAVVITSMLENNRENYFHFYIFSSDLSEDSIKYLNKLKSRYKNFEASRVEVPVDLFKSLKLNIDYISIETYYRYAISDLLPDLDKILYIDADLIINKDINIFYDTDIADYYLAGVEDAFIKSENYKPEIGLSTDDIYINAGVLLMNLQKLRQDCICKKFIEATEGLWDKIKYQDQDIINIVCKGKIKQVDSIYNFARENIMAEPNRQKEACIIHYTGKKKPWLKKKIKIGHVLQFWNWEKYFYADKQWKKYADLTAKIMQSKIKVGLIIDEFFGGAGTAFGGYGFLARKYIAKYIPNDDIQIDVLLGKSKWKFFPQKFHVDNVDLYRLPRQKKLAERFLQKHNYDIYLSIELTSDFVLKHETDENKKLILWIQDPRPKSAWDNVIDTMQSIKDPCFFNQKIYDKVHEWAKKNRVSFISQGYSLNPLAMELYNLPQTVPVQYLPNPVDVDFDFKFDIKKKKKQVIFLGRLEAQKRCWLFCEVAKRMPEYEFFVLGQFFRHQEDNRRMLDPYMDGSIKNLHFVGHVDGDDKKRLIKESRVLLSTAVWEGIPISWLEALSYGTVLVSDLERENLAGRFGTFVGAVEGDGFDMVDKFIKPLKEMMENDELYEQKASAAIDYVRQTHNIERFTNDLREVILEEV
ncbi:MAG: glycosyltransferase, partial [Alphaproteobacteria bacterium]|nr:glycosyltransferase [Alphaproteobacteria bacterium]